MKDEKLSIAKREARQSAKAIKQRPAYWPACHRYES